MFHLGLGITITDLIHTTHNSHFNMKTLKSLSVVFMFAIIAYVWQVTNEPATYHPITDTLEVIPHSEINAYEIEHLNEQRWRDSTLHEWAKGHF